MSVQIHDCIPAVFRIRSHTPLFGALNSLRRYFEDAGCLRNGVTDRNIITSSELNLCRLLPTVHIPATTSVTRSVGRISACMELRHPGSTKWERLTFRSVRLQALPQSNGHPPSRFKSAVTRVAPISAIAGEITLANGPSSALKLKGRVGCHTVEI